MLEESNYWLSGISLIYFMYVVFKQYRELVCWTSFQFQLFQYY